MNELEPLPAEIASLLQELPPPPPAPSAATTAKVLGRIGHTMTVAPVVGAALTAKTVVALIALGAAPGLVAGFVVGRTTATTTPQVELAAAPPPAEAIAPTSPPPSAAEAPKPEEAPAPARPTRDPPRAPRIDPQRPAPAEPAAPAPGNEGRQLIEGARTAMMKSQAQQALTLLREHGEQFPDSQLAEERVSLEVQALLMAGRGADAREAAKRFAARWPNSVFAPVVDAALSTLPTDASVP